MLGSTSLQPSDSYTQFATVPANAWALVRVTGNWMARPNPACANQPPEWPCSTLDPYSPYNSTYPDAYVGPVRLGMATPAGGWDPLELRGSGGTGEAIGLTQREFLRSAYAWPVLNNPTVQQYGNTGQSIPSYIFDGSYTVTVTEIPSPIQVVESEPATDGSRSYTVQPLYGLQLINPFSWSGPAGALRWYFVPGDSVSLQAPNSDPGWTISECSNLTTCEWTPPGPGRVQVAAFVETRRARARSATETELCGGTGCTEGGPQLQVTCTPVSGPNLVRGSLVDCVSTVTPAQEYTITMRRASGDGFTVTDPADISHASGEADHWQGAAVADTKVKVYVELTVNGVVRRRDKEVRFNVTPRQWTVYEITAPTVVYGLSPKMSAAPDVLHDVYGDFDLTVFKTVEAAVSVVGAGPNRGLAFFQDQVQFDGNIGYIWIHPALFPPSAGKYPAGSDSERWYNDQNGQGSGTCTAADIATLLSESLRHEGVTLSSTSHVGIANQHFASDRLDVRFERLYRVGEEQLRIDAFDMYGDWKAGAYRTKQNNFDAVDRPQVWSTVGCTPDLDLSDGN